MKNLAYQNRHSTQLNEMRSLMQQDLETIGRPFGEFIPGGNAAEPGQIDKTNRNCETTRYPRQEGNSACNVKEISGSDRRTNSKRQSEKKSGTRST